MNNLSKKRKAGKILPNGNKIAEKTSQEPANLELTSIAKQYLTDIDYQISQINTIE
jgi:hypothetical protein